MVDTRALTTEGKIEEDVVPADVVKFERRKKAKIMNEYIKKARAVGKPICHACFNRDYPDFLHDWKFYTEMKAIKESPWRVRDSRSPMFNKIGGYHRDYECTHTYMDGRVSKKCPGHTSVWIPIDEYEKEKVAK